MGVGGWDSVLKGTGFEVSGSGFEILGSGVEVQGSGFRIQGSGLEVEGWSSTLTLVFCCATGMLASTGDLSWFRV